VFGSKVILPYALGAIRGSFGASIAKNLIKITNETWHTIVKKTNQL